MAVVVTPSGPLPFSAESAGRNISRVVSAWGGSISGCFLRFLMASPRCSTATAR
jgi:hypothetical protein